MTITRVFVPVLVREDDAAEILATHVKRVKELVREGHLTPHYLDTRPRYLYTELAEYAASLPTERPER